MYSISFTVIAGQYIIADVFQFTLVSPVTGAPMKPALLSIGNVNNFQSIEQNATYGSVPTSQQRSFFMQLCSNIPVAGGVCSSVEFWGNLFFQIFLILTGTEIFQIIVFFGVPGIFALVMLAPYYILLFRALLGYAKNFF